MLSLPETPSSGHLGLLAKRQLCQTSLDTRQGQHESEGSTDPLMERGPRSSWVRAKSAGNQFGHHPSPRVGLRMAGSGMLRTPPWPAELHQGPGAGSCWAAQVPGGRSTFRDAQVVHRRQAGSVKSSKELRLISLPDQN